MTEAEWLSCCDLEAMLWAFPQGVTLRQIRMFGCACCRRIWELLPNESRTAIEVAERFMDRLATSNERDSASKQAAAVALTRGRPWQPDALTYATCAAASVIFPLVTGATACSVAEAVANAVEKAAGESVPDSEYDAVCEAARQQEVIEQTRLLRDIFGNPFRPVALDPLWLTFDVQALARGIYDEKAFDRMPVLADALQDAGCDNSDVLSHCRADAVHVRGCWVLDLLLGKS